MSLQESINHITNGSNEVGGNGGGQAPIIARKMESGEEILIEFYVSNFRPDVPKQ